MKFCRQARIEHLPGDPVPLLYALSATMSD